MTLYLKYRPKNLDELDLLDVGTSLKKILSSDSIPHAFLFAGPKGTGKTSAARIVAKIVNCEHLGPNSMPCDECRQCIDITKGNNLDIIELDAASHRGIDDIRILKDTIKLAPARAKKKIYIIDEAHMLTVEASNALLKTLEEPPEHVIFILATTNAEKLIDTIKSRATIVNFRKALPEEILKSLKRVVEAEKIKISAEGLSSIADISGGAFRDAIKILEQVSLEGEEFLKTYGTDSIDVFINLLIKRDVNLSLSLIKEYSEKGGSIEAFTKGFLEKIHLALLAKNDVIKYGKIDGLNQDDLLYIAEIFSQAYKDLLISPIEALPLMVATIKWCSGGEYKNIDRKLKQQDQGFGTEDQENSHAVKTPDDSTSAQTPQTYADNSNEDNNTDTVISKTESENVKSDMLAMVNADIWKNILLTVRPINASIEGLLRSSKPVSYDGKVLTLGVFYNFHKERLEDIKHRKIVEDVLEKILNSPTKVVCTLLDPSPKIIIEESKKEPVLTETKDKDITKIAEEIFGN